MGTKDWNRGAAARLGTLAGALLVALLLLAPGRAMAGTAGEIPLLPTLDPLNRAEEPLSNGSKWSALGWVTGTGTDTSAGWHPTYTSPYVFGGYWNQATFSDKPGEAASIKMAAGPGANERYVSLWLDMASPGSTKSGYQLRWKMNADLTTYTMTLSKWNAGTESVLNSNASASVPAGTILTLTDTGGTLTAWQGSDSSLSSVLSAADSTFSSGYAGIEAVGSASLSLNFRAGTLIGGEIGGTPVRDDFSRGESPLANGKWMKFPWATEIGGSYTGSFHGYGSSGGVAGAYWNGASFSPGRDGLAVAATVGTGSTPVGQYAALWLDMQSPLSARSGYEARFTGTGSTSVYKAELSKWSSGTRTVLATQENVSLPVGSTFVLTDIEDSIALWTGSSTFVPVLKARDTTFASGYAGIEVNGGNGTDFNFRAGQVALDTQAPDTTITSGPTGTVTPSAASFSFVGSELGSSLECALDGAALSTCTSPKSYASSIMGGPHTFRVRAVDGAGNQDPTPAERSFEVLKAPSATTTPATEVASTSATINGTVNPNGLATTYQFEWGLTTAYGSKVPATAKAVGSGTTEVTVSEPLTGLTPGTTYHRRLVATNAGGTTYGGDRTFTTWAPPRATTSPATGVKAKEAKLEASVTPMGRVTTYYFEYGPTTSYGTKAPLTPGSVGSEYNPVSVSEVVTGLAEGTKYHFRIVAVNGLGTTYGADATFETPFLPEVTAEPALGVTGTEAVLTGSVDANGQPTEYKYEYGPTTAYGNTIVAEEEVPGSAPTETEEGIIELQPETTYHYRVVATSQAGSFVGPDRTFTTSKEAIGQAENLTNFYGVQWGHPDDMDESKGAEMARRAGAKYLRLDLLTDKITQPDMENIFLEAARRHITILPHLGSGVYESGQGPPGWIGQVEAAVRKYGRNGEFWKQHADLAQYAPSAWEVWNEPNYIANGYREEPKKPVEVNPGIYGELLHVTAEAVRRVEKEATILSGGLLSVGKGGGMPVGPFVRGMAHATDYDALAIHPYAFATNNKNKPTGPNGVEEVAAKVQGNIEEARNALKTVGAPKKPLWITEIGFPVEGGEKTAEKDSEYKGVGDGTHFPVTEPIQRDLLNATFKRIKEKAGSGAEEYNIKHVIYYNLQDGADKSWDHHTGLVSEYVNGVAHYRPAWYAFQNWAEMPVWPQKPKAQHKSNNIRPKRLIETDTFNTFGSPTKSWIKWGSGPSSSTYGNFTAAQPLPSLEEGDVDRETEIPGLQPEATYHYRVVAENDAGEKEETPDIQFTTPPSTSTSSTVDQVLHGQPGYAWVSGWVKEGSITGTGPGLNNVYVNVNFVKNGQTILTVHPTVYEGRYETGWVSGLGKGAWETRTVFPPQAGYDESKSDYEPFTVRDGVQIVAKHSGKCMDVSGASSANGIGVMHGECLNPANALNQVFEVSPSGNGFQLMARHSGRCVDVANVSTADGTPIQQWDCNNGGNQQFRQEWWGPSGYARYIAQHSGKCLDVPGASTGWVQFQQWTCSGAEQQLFHLQPVESSPVQTETNFTLDQVLHGSPGLISFHGRLQAGGYSMANRVVHVEIDNADTAGWDTSGGDISFGIDGNNYYEYRDWRLEPGHWNVRARYVGDGHFGESISGTQNFTVKRGYLIRGRASNRCLQLSENKNQNGQPFIIWDCSAVNGNGQVFSFVSRGNGWYDLRPNGTNRCVDVENVGTGDGVNLQLWDCLGDNQWNQHWRREPIAGQAGWYALIARHSGKCADVKEEKTNNGQRVWQWGCTWHGNQQWALEGVIDP